MTQTSTVSERTTFPLYPEAIPGELKAGRSWVVCDPEKVPMIPLVKGWRRASSTDPRTWRYFGDALEAFETGRYAGVGRVIEAESSFVGIDLDDCLDLEAAEIDPWAWRIVDALDSYSEISPSGRGVKIWIKANLEIAYVKPGLEVYPRARYFVATGQTLPQFPMTVQDRGAVLAEIISKEFRKPKKKSQEVGDHRLAKSSPGEALDLDKLLEATGVNILAVLADSSAAVKYRVTCPWVAEHTDSEDSGTYVGQYEDGALFFQCHHAHCFARDWASFRAKVCPIVCLGRPSRSKARRVWRRGR